MLMIILNHQARPRAYYQLYNSIFLSAFFFVAGYTFNPRTGFIDFLSHKARTLLIPFLSLGIINMILAMIADGDLFRDRIMFIFSIRGRWDDLWFIACLFSAEILFYFLLSLTDKVTDDEPKRSIFLLSGSLLLAIGAVYYVRLVDFPLPLQIEDAFINLWIVAFGYCFKQNKNKASIPHWIILSTLYILICLIYDNDVSVKGAYYQNYPIYLLSVVIGLLAFINCSKLLERFKDFKIIKGILFIGQNTLVYYAFQSKAIRLCNLVIDKLGISLNIYIRCVVVTVISAFILAIPAYIMLKYFPLLLGKKRTTV